jgi:hypothetical protein
VRCAWKNDRHIWVPMTGCAVPNSESARVLSFTRASGHDTERQQLLRPQDQ